MAAYSGFLAAKKLFTRTADFGVRKKNSEGLCVDLKGNRGSCRIWSVFVLYRRVGRDIRSLERTYLGR